MSEHDELCEQGPNFYLCHCSKRRREARGLTQPPEEALYFPPPSCPVCDDGLDHDGDCWRCHTCALAWPNDGYGARFVDDYGEIVDKRTALLGEQKP